MKVSLNPSICKSQRSFNAGENQSKSAETSSYISGEQKINDAQIKKFKANLGVALSLVLALDIIYFAIKHRIASNKADILSQNRKTLLNNAKKLIHPEVSSIKLDI